MSANPGNDPIIRFPATAAPSSGVGASGREQPSPHSREAEEGVIGGLLAWPERFVEVRRLLPGGARDFHVDRLQQYYGVIEALLGRGELVTSVTVANALGGDLTEVWAEAVTLEQVATYPDKLLSDARVVAAKARRRRAIDLARSLVHDAYLEPSDEAFHVTVAAIVEGLASDRDRSEQGSRFRLRPLSSLRDLERAPMLDPELRLRTDQLGLIYARENVGKSAIVLARMALLASQGRHVIYVCGEGLSGILDRLDAIIATYGYDAAEVERCFHLVDESPQFVSHADVGELISEAQALEEEVALIVFDTLATATEGQNENAPEVMTAVIGGVRRVMRTLGCAALLVHHAGKDAEKGPRGHSSLPSGIDMSYEVSLTLKPNVVQLLCRKARYDARGWKLFYELRPITLDAYGDTSAIVALPSLERPEGGAELESAGPTLHPSDHQTLRALATLKSGMLYSAWVREAGLPPFNVPPSTAKASIPRLLAAGRVTKDAKTNIYSVLAPLPDET